ncbi:DUF1127 domain-containing protein [Bradyrhizobium sp. McL0616]|uniref:DUF1127 domain-containing protein n=1 Tax=Bradyrhizobium sp. McL0616 TaxID=3415674 RepID=UPI003CF21532
MKTHSRRVIALVRPDDSGPDGQGWIGWSDGRGMARLSSERIARRGTADIGSHPALPAAAPDREVSLFRSVAFAFMEGFALYGAALHPSAAMPVHAILTALREREPDPDNCESAQPSGRDGAGSNGNVIRFDRALPLDARPERRWNWLRSAGETLTVLLAHVRREREIKRAIAALMQLDDRTLRDLGISSRSEIEWTVRYCHDC